jgi:putative salt-induced outer membrane protein YdiY
MPLRRLLPLCCLCLVLGSTAEAGIILNTLDALGEGRPGWSGGLDAGFSASGGNTEVVSLRAGGRLLRRTEDDVWRLQGSAERSETGGVESARAVVGHLRQNHHLGGPLYSIAFAQVQHNPFQRLRSRWLFGAGGRWDLSTDARGAVSVGATHMVERERIRDEQGATTDQRLSAFLRLGRSLREGVTLDLVGFYQPLWSDFADARAMGIATLRVELTGSLSLQVGGNLDYDARPPAGVGKTDWQTTTGLGVRF